MRAHPSLGRAALAVAVVTVIAGCGGAGGGGGGSAAGDQDAVGRSGVESTSACGLGNGKKATGTPIKLGALNTKQPGTDFSGIGLAAKAYFDCVNDNGGIYGHPIRFSEATEDSTAGRAAAQAKKLVEATKVLGLVGNSSLIEADVNHRYYESKGYYVIGAGIAPSAYSTSHFASINMGARYSSDGAAQWALDVKKAEKVVFDQSKVPGAEYNYGGVALVAKKRGVPFQQFQDPVPINDASSIAQKLVAAAGKDGAVVLNFTPPEAAKILQAAQKLNLQDDVKAWACSTPCNTDSLAATLGPGWNGKFGVNAELQLLDHKGPDSTLYRAVIGRYAKSLGLGSFTQMGFTAGRIATKALLDMGRNATYTVKSVNAAFKGVKDFKTDILCKPWYYGSGALHIPNNADRTVTPAPEGKKMVQTQGCFDIDAVDPDIAKVRAIEASES